jgi:hypothetical protein
MIGRLKGKLGVITKSFAFMADILTFDMGRLEKISNAVRWPNAVKKICFWMIFGKRVRLGVREMAFLL